MNVMAPLRRCAGKTALCLTALVGVGEYHGIAFDHEAEQVIEQIQRERDSSGGIVDTFANAPPTHSHYSLTP